MIPYLNENRRGRLMLLAYLEDVLAEMAKDELFSFASKDIKSARAFSERAYQAIEAQLESKERLRVHRIASSHRLIIVPKHSPKKDETLVVTEDLHELISRAMGNECVGCQVSNWKMCTLRRTLEAVGTPPANEDGKKVCRFSQ